MTINCESRPYSKPIMSTLIFVLNQAWCVEMHDALRTSEDDNCILWPEDCHSQQTVN